MGEVVRSLSADIKWKVSMALSTSPPVAKKLLFVLLHSEPSETLRPKQETNPQEAGILI